MGRPLTLLPMVVAAFGVGWALRPGIEITINFSVTILCYWHH